MAGEKVWFIDDNRAYRALFCIVFSDELYDITSFEKPDEALALLEGGGQPPHAVVCDLHIPNGISGDEFYRLAEPYLQRTAKMFITGYAGKGEFIPGFPDIPVIKKPCSNDTLKSMVREGIEAIARNQ